MYNQWEELYMIIDLTQTATSLQIDRKWVKPNSCSSYARRINFYENVFTESLNTQEGRKALSRAMYEPISRSLEYQSIGRKLLMIDEHPRMSPAEFGHEVSYVTTPADKGFWIDKNDWVKEEGFPHILGKRKSDRRISMWCSFCGSNDIDVVHETITMVEHMCNTCGRGHCSTKTPEIFRKPNSLSYVEAKNKGWIRYRTTLR